MSECERVGCARVCWVVVTAQDGEDEARGRTNAFFFSSQSSNKHLKNHWNHLY